MRRSPHFGWVRAGSTTEAARAGAGLLKFVMRLPKILRPYASRIALPTLLAWASLVTAAPPQALDPALLIDRTRVLQGASPQGAGGGYWTHEASDELDAKERALIHARIAQNLARLNLPAPVKADSTVFAWPVRQAGGWADYGFHVIANYFDHNASYPGQVRDYQCGNRSYDRNNGYNHQGTDISSWPFAWLKMNEGGMEVVAAAPGTIVDKIDGNFDRSCSFAGASWNAVYVRHDDGSIAWYGHLKSGSLTTRQIGERVQTGETLGVVGSSGNSSGPHLHFEVYDAANQLIDPWAGSCNTRTTRSWWAAQRPYHDPALLMLTTGWGDPDFPACPGTENPKIKHVFAPGERIYLTSYFRDQPSGQSADFTMYRPDGAVFSQWQAGFTQYYVGSYWYWYFTLPASAPTGSWTVQAVFNGKTHRSYFQVAQSSANIPRATAIEYYNTTLGHYFMTAYASEASFVDGGGAGPGWVRTGMTFQAFLSLSSPYLVNAASVCRFYGAGPNSHFYTADGGECAFVRANDPGWSYEGIAFLAYPAIGGACTPGTQPVYRAYNGRWQQNDSNHRFTTSWSEYQRMQANGWNGEGVVMCAWP
ncbi:MAG: peptidoglycan DD-metalloendopeptidase family protein [Burkholderiales bacterium]|nr:MAG: peptidoglycan DD-metalloendopeptidase family protein [Burkholderiales bacterium]